MPAIMGTLFFYMLKGSVFIDDAYDHAVYAHSAAGARFSFRPQSFSANFPWKTKRHWTDSQWRGLVRAADEWYSANRSLVHVMFYIMKHDAISLEFLYLLKDKAEAGIPVYLLIDRIRAWKWSGKHCAALKKAGCKSILKIGRLLISQKNTEFGPWKDYHLRVKVSPICSTFF